MSEAAKLLRAARDADADIHAEAPGASAARVGGAGAGASAAGAAPHVTIDPTFDPAAEWAMIPQTVGGLLSMAMPELAPVYAPERCMEWGRAFHAVAQKYGWQFPSVGPELALIVSSASFLVPTAVLVRARLAARKAQRSGEAPKQEAPKAEPQE